MKYAPCSFPTADFHTLAGTGPTTLNHTKNLKIFFQNFVNIALCSFHLVFIAGLGLEIGPRKPECEHNPGVQPLANPAVKMIVSEGVSTQSKSLREEQKVSEGVSISRGDKSSRA